MPAWILLILGLLLLYFGAESLIRGSASLAIRIGLSPLVVGLTVVGFGTSSPELIVSVRAALTDSPGIALGNVIGSNICNIALILGVSAFIRPLTINRQLLRFDVPVMIGCSLALVLFIYDSSLSRIEGGLLLTGILAYIAFSLYSARRGEAGAETQHHAVEGVFRSGCLTALAMVLAGFVVLILGARFFVDGAVGLAESMGVSNAVIGLTIVALGTSLPELATSVIASIKGEGDISTGNIIGSNIFNILCILGVTALVHPLATSSIGPIDLLVMTGLALLAYPLLRSDFRLSRLEGFAFLAIYVAYTTYLF